jgi:hypothetical protein
MSLPVLRHRVMVMTSYPNNSPHTRRVLLRLATRKHKRCACKWKQCCLFFFFFIIKAFCTMNSLLKVRQLIKVFIWQFWDVCRMQYKESDLKCGLQKTLLHHDNAPANTVLSDSSWQNIQFLPPSSLDLSPTNFFLFPQLKITLKGRFQKTHH